MIPYIYEQFRNYSFLLTVIMTRKGFFRITLYTLSLPFLTVLLYLVLSVFLGIIPVNRQFNPETGDIDVYVQSNGVHTNVIVPYTHEVQDWNAIIKPEHFSYPDRNIEYLAFGWGDRDFYINTPTWSDLRLSTAFNALFWRGTAVLHVTAYPYAPSVDRKTVHIKISEEEYRLLSCYIEKSFITENDTLVPVRFHYLYENDAFFEGKGRYSFIKTCNVWTSQALKHAGIRTAFWAPFDWNILYHHRRSE
ncbi:MAG: TIGR02117 family protein [Cytophagaceae bacterium]